MRATARLRHRFARRPVRLKSCLRFDEQFREPCRSWSRRASPSKTSAPRLRDYAEGIEASPERLAEVEDRLAALDRLKRKYGPTLDDVIALGAELERKLNEMENKDEVLRKLRLELATAAEEYLEAARALSRQRYEAARKLEKLVESEINELAMKARFKVEVSGSDEEANWTARGFDQVQYLISANPGEPLGPVDEIASGGELSRVMLALKTSIESGRASEAEADEGAPSTLPSVGKRVGSMLAANPGLRRDRRRHWRPRGRSRRQEVEAALAHQAGTVHHPPAADRVVRRPALPDREERSRRQNQDLSAAARRRRAHAGDCPHDERREADRNLAETRRADAEGESVKQCSEIRGWRASVIFTIVLCQGTTISRYNIRSLFPMI